MIESHPRIYFDNAATSFPKPKAVLQAMTDYATQLGASPGRGSYHESREAGRLLDQCRTRIRTLINGESDDQVIFTLNCSDALNHAIRGIVWADHTPTHLITTDLDHNSVLRPFNALCKHDHITQTRVPCDPVTGRVDPEDVRRAILPETRLIAIVHGSNVTGTLQPIGEVGAIAREHDIPFLVDAAQTVGHLPIDVQAMNIDLLAAPGHKGLLGPLGTGFLYIRPGIEKRMTTIREGGTGSVSEDDTQPAFMPDRFEPGSHNTIGLIGLSEGVKYILDRTVDDIWSHEKALIKTFIESVSDWGEMPGFHLYGPPTVKHRCGVFSVRIDGFGPNELADRLENDYGILTRPGLHCAPHAHRTIGTIDLPAPGTTRFSFGPFLSTQEVKFACDALGHICHQSRDAAAVG